MGTIRIETDGINDLARVHRWMALHRGQVVQLDASRRLTLGVPISGAGAVIVAAVLEDERHDQTQLGGVLRAVASRSPAEPVHLVFEGRSPAGLMADDAGSVAAALLHDIDSRIAADEIEPMVA